MQTHRYPSSRRRIRRIPTLSLVLLLATRSAWSFSQQKYPSALHQHVASSHNTRLYNIDPSAMLYAEQEKLLVQRGQVEAELMENLFSPLEANVVKGSGSGGGFAKGGGNKKSLLKTEAAAHAKVLQQQGVVRIDNVLDPKLADDLREQVYQLRKESEALVASGQVPRIARFADVLLKENRCDLTLPLDQEWALRGMASILTTSAVGATLAKRLGTDAVLREWSCLMSDPGSSRQVMHPDTPFQKDNVPVLYTCFVALQDITLEMGPTTWLPKTHAQASHEQFQDETVPASSSFSPKDELLKNTPAVLGLLPKGACAIFDSRLLHCGGANVSRDTSRALMYCSFQNAKVANPGNPGSIRKELIGQHTLQELTKDLEKFTKGKAMKRLKLVDES